MDEGIYFAKNGFWGKVCLFIFSDTLNEKKINSLKTEKYPLLIMEQSQKIQMKKCRSNIIFH